MSASSSARIGKVARAGSPAKRPRAQIHMGGANARDYVEDTMSEKDVALFIIHDQSGASTSTDATERAHNAPLPQTESLPGTPRGQAKAGASVTSKMDDHILDRLVRLLSSGCSIQLACNEVCLLAPSIFSP